MGLGLWLADPWSREAACVARPVRKKSLSVEMCNSHGQRRGGVAMPASPAAVPTAFYEVLQRCRLCSSMTVTPRSAGTSWTRATADPQVPPPSHLRVLSVCFWSLTQEPGHGSGVGVLPAACPRAHIHPRFRCPRCSKHRTPCGDRSVPQASLRGTADFLHLLGQLVLCVPELSLHRGLPTRRTWKGGHTGALAGGPGRSDRGHVPIATVRGPGWK